MRLVYLWIERYGCFNGQGFRFSSKYHVDFNKKDNTIVIQKNEDDIGDLLFGGNIDFTAIVGNNGAGKSTLLDFIRKFLFQSSEFNKENLGFLIFENNKDSGRFTIYDYTQNSLNAGENSLSFEVRKGAPFEQYIDPFPDLLYYSEILEYKYYDNDFDDGNDQITSGDPLFYPDREWSQYNISSSYLIKNNGFAGNSVRAYFHADIKRQIVFFEKLKNRRGFKKYIPFSIPKGLGISIDILDTDIFRDVLDDSLESYEYQGQGHHGENNTDSFTIGLLKRMKDLHRKLFHQINSGTLYIDELLCWNIFMVFLYNLLYDRKSYGDSEKDDYEEADDLLGKLLNSEFPDINNVFETIRSMLDRSEEEIEIYSFFYSLIKDLRDSNGNDIQIDIKCPENISSLNRPGIMKYFNPNDITKDFFSENGGNYVDELNKKLGWSGLKDKDIFSRFFDSYAKISSNIDFLKFEWGLSSGEYNMFNLYGRLSEKMDIISSRRRKDMIAVFDELDSTYHPEWQQRIVSALQSFFADLYPHINIHIILTTHSPVLLSDVPQDNVIFIRERQARENQDEENQAEENHRQTFAANIATLYYDSFFMKKGSIGELAKDQINALYSALCKTENIASNGAEKEKFLVTEYFSGLHREVRLNENDNAHAIVNQLYGLIRSVGEDIWRYKLEAKMNRCFDENEEARHNQELSAYIRRLRDRQGEIAVQKLIEEIKGKI